MSEFRKKLEHLINSESLENRSNTPDFILAGFLADCLKAFELSVNVRDKWHDKSLSDGKRWLNDDEEHASRGKTIGEQKDIIILINHGLDDYDIKFIQQIEKRIDKALSSLGFSRSTTTKESKSCEMIYFQFATVCQVDNTDNSEEHN